MVAVAASKARPVVPVPPPLRPFLKLQRLPERALAPIRRVLETDEGFRRFVLPAASEELVGPAGWLWLHRPEGWQGQLQALVDQRASASADEASARAERSAVKRVDAAEAAARRSAAAEASALGLAEQLRTDLDRERGDRRDTEEQLAKARSRLTQLETELRGTRRRIDAVAAEASDAAAETGLLQSRLTESEAALAVSRAEADLLRAQLELLRTSAESVATAGAPTTRESPVIQQRPALIDASIVEAIGRAAEAGRLLGAALADVAAMVERVGSATSGPTSPSVDGARSIAPSAARRERATRPARAAVSLPGGVRSGTREAVDHVLRADGVEVIIDGYNLAKRLWPGLDLVDQRTRAIDLVAGVGTRFGRAPLVVFDGANVIGPAVARPGVRVRFSPAGTIADDLIVDLIAATQSSTPVMVVTDDGDLRRRVAAQGAVAVRLEPFVASARWTT